MGHGFSENSIAIRPLAAADLGYAHGLSRLAGWNQTLRDWERFLALGDGGCFLSECDRQPAGTATTTCYGGGLAWIGMVLVHPDFRRRGLGTALLRHAIRHLRESRGIACVRLDATPEGQPLYEGLGFRAEWSLRRWRRPAAGGDTAAAFPSAGLERPEQPPLHPSANSLKLDREVFGADRSALLRSLAEGSLAAVSCEDGSFAYLREGERALYLGPAIATSFDSGLDLVARLSSETAPSREIFWDIPDENLPAAAFAAEHGFKPVRTLTRMYLGDEALPADPSRIFALAEPGLG